MKKQILGNIQVTRVVEMEGPSFAPVALLPDATPGAMEDVVAEHNDWLHPTYVDPASGMLIMSSHSFVLRTPQHTILVDTCVGNDKSRPGHDRWHMRNGRFLERLRRAGVRPEDVDFILCTHLHADHVGWNTRLVDGRWVPTFPNAKYIFARREYEYWEMETMRAPQEPVNIGSFEDSVLPVIAAGQAVLVDSDHQIEDGIWLEPAPGHTPGNVIVNVVSGDGRALLSGDVIHHPVQLARPEWSSRFCQAPDESRQTRRTLIERLAETDTIILAAHFPAPTAGRIVCAREAFRIHT